MRGSYMRVGILLAFLALEWIAQTAAAEPPNQIPFVVGLSTMRAVSRPSGDYETVQVLNESPLIKPVFARL